MSTVVKYIVETIGALLVFAVVALYWIGGYGLLDRTANMILWGHP